MTTTRAASRLKKKPVSLEKKGFNPERTRPSTAISRHKSATVQNSLLIQLAKQYLLHLPTLLIGLAFSFASYKIITRVHPDSIKHLLLPNSYLPLLLSVFFALFFVVSFLLLNSRRGFLLAYFATIILFLKLQQVELSAITALLIAAPFLLLELLLSLLIFIKNKK